MTKKSKGRKKGAPPVGLWLKVGPDLAMAELVRDLRQIFFVINGSAYERNMHALEVRGDPDDPEFKENARDLYEFAKANGMACIFRGEPAAARDLGADGVLVSAPGALTGARDIFGDDGIVGLHCGTSSELAAQAHDAGADFVAFGAANGQLPGPDALRFWNALRFWTILSDKPALVEGPLTNDYAAYFVQQGAAFLDAGDYIWSHGEGVMKGTVNMLHAIDLALEEQREKKQ
jgi:thiamine-phosphate pyrophosphorylase